MSVSEKDKEIARIGSGHEGFSTTPDIHWVKKGVTSVVAPPNVASVDQLGTGATTTALIENKPVWTLKGRIDSGDLPSGPGHAGTDGGIISGRYRGICLAVTGSPQTMFESSPAVRTDDFTVQDCDGTPLPNCAGRVIRKGDEQALAAAAKYVDSLCRLERLEGVDTTHGRPFGVSKGKKMPASGLGNYIEVLAGDSVAITATRVSKATGMTPTCPKGKHPPTDFRVSIDDPYDDKLKPPTQHGDVLVLGPNDVLAVPRVTVDLNNLSRDASHGYIRMGQSFQLFDDADWLNPDLDQPGDLGHPWLKNAASVENIYQLLKWSFMPRRITVTGSACAGTEAVTVAVFPPGSFTIDLLAIYQEIKAAVQAIRDLMKPIDKVFSEKKEDAKKKTAKETRKERRARERNEARIQRKEEKNAAREAKKNPERKGVLGGLFNDGKWKTKKLDEAAYLAFEYVEVSQAGIDAAIAAQEAQKKTEWPDPEGESEEPAPAPTPDEDEEPPADPQRARLVAEVKRWEALVQPDEPNDPAQAELARARERLERYDDAIQSQFANYEEMLQDARDDVSNLEREQEEAEELERWLEVNYPIEYKLFMDGIANGTLDLRNLPSWLPWSLTHVDWKWLYEVHCFQDRRIEEAEKQVDHMLDVVLAFGSKYGLDPITHPGACSVDTYDVEKLRSLNPALCSLEMSLLFMFEPVVDVKWTRDIPLLAVSGPLGIGSVVEEILKWLGADIQTGLYLRIEFQFVLNFTIGARWDAYGRISLDGNAQASAFLFVGFALKLLGAAVTFKGGLRGRLKFGWPTRTEMLRGQRDPTSSTLLTFLFHGDVQYGGEATCENSWLGFESTTRMDQWKPWLSDDYPVSIKIG